ncbi:hypothetical protein ZIOFF_022464 [Zingiber officinale]|uniref:Uncharacterized protein n=1 Tax=Zingiber officinale TaxID=94328 RepID=A0A8J5HCP4_ZINOF|nr:hypothetical protein ZIOFF_022464 [Zingiber officinale]
MTTTAETKRNNPPAGCDDDICGVRDTWLLHHIRHRTVFRRLCTNCVLRYHPGCFCASCFDLLLDGGGCPVVRCSRCPSVSHAACLPDPAGPFFCSICSDAGSSATYFPRRAEKSLDIKLAKVLLAAAQLAAASMSRAASSAKADADRKVKEAAIARKRAREALERVTFLSKSEKEKKKSEADLNASLSSKPEVVDHKKKMPKLNNTVATMVAKIPNRERDRWMRFQEPIRVVQKQVQVNAEGKNNLDFMVEMQSHAKNVEAERRLISASHAPNALGQMERDERGALKRSQGGHVNDDVGTSVTSSLKRLTLNCCELVQIHEGQRDTMKLSKLVTYNESVKGSHLVPILCSLKLIGGLCTLDSMIDVHLLLLEIV